MPPKRKAPAAASTKEENDGAPEVKKRGRTKASEPDQGEAVAAAAPASPVVPLRKSGRKPKEVVALVQEVAAKKPAAKDKTEPKEKPAAKAKVATKEKPVPKEKSEPKEKPAAAKTKVAAAPKEKPVPKEKPAPKSKAAVAPKEKAPAKKKAVPAKDIEGVKSEGEEDAAASPAKGKVKPPAKKVPAGKAAAKAKKEAKEDSDVQELEEQIPAKKKTKASAAKEISPPRIAKEATEKVEEDDAEGVERPVLVSNGVEKSVIIEACKQCNAFKTRAIQVQQYLQKSIPGLEVSINPEKPRRGCFEIRDNDGNIFISLLGMPRPFAKMKALDMDDVAADVVGQLQ